MIVARHGASGPSLCVLLLACGLAGAAPAAAQPAPGSDPELWGPNNTVGDRTIFSAWTAQHGYEMWGTDGTPEGTELLVDAFPGVDSSFPEAVTLLPQAFLFTAIGDPEAGRDLWATDGTPEGTRRLTIGSHLSSRPAIGKVSHRGLAFFNGPYPDLWVTDGTRPGTAFINHAGGGGGESFGDDLIYLTFSSIWRTDGTPAGTIRLLSTDAGTIHRLRTFDHGAVATSYKIGAGYELWGTDGTPEGSGFVADIAPGEQSARYEDPFVSVGGAIVFVADDLTHGRQLWRTDGTTAGTFPLTSFPAGAFPPNLFPLNLAGAGDFALIQVDDGVHGAEMWRTDGTVNGTHLLLDACPGPCSSMASGIQVFEIGTAWFYTRIDGHDRLWRTDGTPAGTHLFTDACPGSCGFHVITPVGDSIVARVYIDGRSGMYAFDEQAPEARLLAEFPDDLLPYYRSRAGETVVFIVDDGVHGEELWRTDGTAEGTFLLRDLVTPEDLVVPPAADPPSAPLHLSAEPLGADAVRLRWDDTAGDELRFEVERIWAGAGFYRRIATVPKDGEELVAEGLTPGTPYTFRVRAQNAAGTSAWSNEASATPAAPAAGPCVASDEALCLLGGRFEVRVAWRDQHNGGFGVGHAAPFPGSARTGTFWFFNQANVELIVKELDGGPVNGHFWTFYGALSDVEYWVTVTDTAARTNRTYHNPPGEVCGRGDTASFPAGVPAAGSAAAGGGQWPGVLEVPAGEIVPIRRSPGEAHPGSSARVAGETSTMDGRMSTFGAGSVSGPRAVAFEPAPLAAPDSTGPCVPGAETLCLLGGRFRVEVAWHDQHNGGDGVGHAVAGTDKSGYFWFFNQANVELVVKALDGRPVNGRFWIFYGALSDVEYTITVTDTVAGQTKTYVNQPGDICGRADTTAF